jgi:trans-aconitate methyltransferase
VTREDGRQCGDGGERPGPSPPDGLDALVERLPVTVLDLSATALALAKERLGARGDAVNWIAADLLAWTPARAYALWHDRAVLHFFTRQEDRVAYAERVREAVAPGGHAIIAPGAHGAARDARRAGCVTARRRTDG